MQTVDPGARQWNGSRPEHAIGCVVHPATEVAEPGVIQHAHGDEPPTGEPSGGHVQPLSTMIGAAGLRAPLMSNIRDGMWLKLRGGLPFDPISALAHATLDVITSAPGTRVVAKAMTLEGQAIADSPGMRFRVDVERRIDGAGAVGARKTSMLQDLERGREMDIDSLMGVVQGLGRLISIPAPTTGAVLALAQQRASVAGLN